MKKKIGRLAEPVMLAGIGEYRKGENTMQTRWALLRMAHYYHLLQSMGDDGPENLSKMEAYCELARP